jgi:hypothetical protein
LGDVTPPPPPVVLSGPPPSSGLGSLFIRGGPPDYGGRETISASAQQPIPAASSVDNAKRVQFQLHDVQSIMGDNMQKLLERGDTLDSLQRHSGISLIQERY